MREWERFFQFAVDLLCVIQTNGTFKQVNPAFEEILGYKREDLLGRQYMDFIHPDDRTKTQKALDRMMKTESVVRLENQFRCQDGSYKWLSWTTHPYFKEGDIYAIARDITEERQVKEELERMAFTDDLTGLLNRRGFFLFANQLMEIALREKKNVILMIADLDNLKSINDHYGHHAGDQGILAGASILSGRFRSSDVLARMGGDEFIAAMIVEPGIDPQSIRHDIEELVRTAPLQDYFEDETLTLSVGFSVSQVGRRISLEEMIVEADRMMYKEKKEKSRCRAA